MNKVSVNSFKGRLSETALFGVVFLSYRYAQENLCIQSISLWSKLRKFGCAKLRCTSVNLDYRSFERSKIMVVESNLDLVQLDDSHM